ncbi:MAG: hypothetical protein ACXWWU_06380 [Candidatus Limnocylindria bacterium]
MSSQRRFSAYPRLASVAALLVVILVGCSATVPATPSPVPTNGQPTASDLPQPSSQPTGQSTVAPTTTAAPSQAAFTIPEPPHAASSPPGSIDYQAVAVAAAVAPGGQVALAPLLTAYHTAGLPVIGFNGESLVGDPEDPVGLPYWMVWLSAGAKPDFRLPLADATKLLVAMENPPDLDPTAMADALLADIREMADGADPQQRFFARFVAALATQAGTDPLDAAATTDSVMLNSMATTYLMAGVLRGVMTEVVMQDPARFASRNGLFASIGGVRPGPPPARVTADASPCNFTGVSEQVAFWAQFVASKLAAGIQLPGMQGATRSLVSLVTRGNAIASRIGGAAGWASSLLNALGLVIQLTHIDVDIVLDPEPLERTKSSGADGKESTLTAAVLFDLKGSSLDGGEGVGNCLALLLNGLGIQTSLPSDGRIAGATVIFEGKTGFNQGLGSGGFVQFPNQAQLRQDTDQNGEVHIQVQGIHQKKDKPQYAPEWMREASVHIHSTTGAVNERNIATAFVNGLTATSAGPAGALGAIADALATVRWDIGERIFRVKDWLEGWYINQSFRTGMGSGHIIGQKCDGPDGQWTPEGVYDAADAQGNQVWNIDISMQTNTSGRGLFTYSDVQIMPIGGASVITTGNARGEVTLDIDPNTGVAKMNMRETYHVFRATTTVGGHGSDQNAPLQSYDMTWQPGGDCDPPPP